MNPGRFDRGSFVSAGSIRPGSFQPNFGASRFGIQMYLGGSFRPLVFSVQGVGWGGGGGTLSIFLHTRFWASIQCLPNKLSIKLKGR